MDVEVEQRLSRIEKIVKTEEKITTIEVFSVRIALMGLLILGLLAVVSYGVIELIKFISHQLASIWS